MSFSHFLEFQQTTYAKNGQKNDHNCGDVRPQCVITIESVLQDKEEVHYYAGAYCTEFSVLK